MAFIVPEVLAAEAAAVGSAELAAGSTAVAGEGAFASKVIPGISEGLMGKGIPANLSKTQFSSLIMGPKPDLHTQADTSDPGYVQ